MFLAILLALGVAAPAAPPPSTPSMSAAPAAPAAVAPVEIPAPTGPYKVGTTSWRVTDPARPETFAVSAAGGTPRQVEVLAWYPAAANAQGKPAPYLRAGLAELPPPFRSLGDVLPNVRTHATLDAPPLAGRKKLPVLVFSHGFGGVPSAYTALLEDLASHGYVVLSIVHPYEATAATLADGQVVTLLDATGKPRQPFFDVLGEWAHEDDAMAKVTGQKKEADQLRLLREYLAGLHATNDTLHRWVADTRLVLDRLSNLPADATPTWLVSRLDLSRIGAFGHSMGGVTSGQFCLEDRRCRAGLNLDGIPQYGTMIDGHLPVPFLMVYSARPGRTGASDAIYGRAASPYYRVDVRDTLHLDFSDMVLWGGPLHPGKELGTLAPARAVEITRAIVRQYFDQELLGQRSPLLEGNAGKAFPEVTIRRKAS
jgi:dienelactone hydrolase